VLVRVAGPQGLVQGIARDANGQPAPGLAVRTEGQPWLVFSANDGGYATLGGGWRGADYGLRCARRQRRLDRHQHHQSRRNRKSRT
jgi:hypothetical protein